MSSIVQELQALSTDRTGSVTDLLRKAKIVASKLDLPEFLLWIENELNGYRGDLEIPPYRILRGQPKGFNPYQGWIPILFEKNPDIQELISEAPCNQSVGELEELYRRGSKGLRILYPPEQQAILRNAFGLTTEYTLIIQPSLIAAILDSVRNIILDWSLKLEKEGILGEGLSFSEKEKQTARQEKVQIKIGKIEKLVGTVGPISDQATVSIKQVDATATDKIRALTGQIRKHLSDIGLTREDRKEVERAIQEIDAELEKDNLEAGRISKFLSSLKRIAEGASGNLIAQGIIANIDKIATYF